MGVITGQTTSTSTGATYLCAIPAGAASVVLSNAGPATASVGPTPGSGQSLLLGNGLLVLPSVSPTSFTTFANSKGELLSFCSTANGSSVTLSWLISY